jgi:hypothetical protein
MPAADASAAATGVVAGAAEGEGVSACVEALEGLAGCGEFCWLASESWISDMAAIMSEYE